MPQRLTRQMPPSESTRKVPEATAAVSWLWPLRGIGVFLGPGRMTVGASIDLDAPQALLNVAERLSPGVCDRSGASGRWRQRWPVDTDPAAHDQPIVGASAQLLRASSEFPHSGDVPHGQVTFLPLALKALRGSWLSVADTPHGGSDSGLAYTKLIR